MAPNKHTNLVFKDTHSDIEIDSNSGRHYVLHPVSQAFPHVVSDDLTPKMVLNIQRGLEGHILKGKNIVYVHGDLAKDLAVKLNENYDSRNVALFFSEKNLPSEVSDSMNSSFGNMMAGVRVNYSDLSYYDK